MTRARVRRSLVLELVALVVVVSAASTVTTAWLTVRTTAVAIHQEQGQTLADESRIYDALLAYAGAHADWWGSRPLVDELARTTGYRIVLTTADREVLVDSAGEDTDAPTLPTRALATVDPHAVDARLAGTAVAEPICVRRAAEASPAVPRDAARAPDATAAALAACLDAARRAAPATLVAPAALLFASAPHSGASTFLDLSTANRARILAATTLVLLAALAVTAAVGGRIVRPLRRLARAATEQSEGDLSARADVRGGDELGRLASAFNTMAERRERLEAQRIALMNDVAHELRTPLSNVRGWLEATQDGLVRDEDDVVASLLDETILLQRIVDDLRDLALADAGALRLHPEPIDLDGLLEQVVAAHTARAQDAHVRLAARRGGGQVWADPIRLRQAIGNLVSNALRHTPPGGSVTLRPSHEPGAVLVEVADTGTGIAQDDLDHVFDRFWRADGSRSRATGGSGLGLPIVRGLVEAHGGSVRVESDPGRGSVFTVRLPVPSGAPPGPTRLVHGGR